MKTAMQMIVVLTLITIISGGLLAAFDSYTSPHIEANRLKILKSAISDVLPKHDYYTEVKSGDKVVYIAMLDSADEPVGLAFKVVGSGFQGKIAMMIGIQSDFKKLTGLKVLEQVETPGLGTKIEEDSSNSANPFWFSKQFKGLFTRPLIRIIKNQKPTNSNEIQAITGATISSQAVVRILNDQIASFKMAYQDTKN